MSEEQRIEAVRDYLRGLEYAGERERKKADPVSRMSGIQMLGMGSALRATSDDDIASLLDAGRVLNGAERQAG